MSQAIALQRRVLANAASQQRPGARDFLLLAMFLHADKRVPEAIAAIEDGLRLHPQDAELHENLGVCHLAVKDFPAGVTALERALALGSASTNVMDGLVRALSMLGRQSEANRYGRQALEAKDRQFGAGAALGKILAAPPPFEPRNVAENVIAYALWGADHRYLMPLLENVRLRNHLFPAWTIRVYLDRSVPEDFRQTLEKAGAQIRLKELPKDEPPARKLLWRFEVIADTQVKRFLVRDADSLLSVKERVAVDAWLRSEKYFHVMRDFHTHTDLVLAGMWGGVGGILPPLQTLLDNFKPWRLENTHIDQDLLTVTVWPTLKQSCLIHDSAYTGCHGVSAVWRSAAWPSHRPERVYPFQTGKVRSVVRSVAHAPAQGAARACAPRGHLRDPRIKTTIYTGLSTRGGESAISGGRFHFAY